MNEIPKTNLTDQRKSRLNEISKIENYFNQETNQRKTYREKYKYEKMKENVRNVSEKQENTRLNSAYSRT